MANSQTFVKDGENLIGINANPDENGDEDESDGTEGDKGSEEDDGTKGEDDATKGEDDGTEGKETLIKMIELVD